MKKLFAIILVVALLFSFTACGKKDEPKKEFSRGVVTGTTYENEFLGLGMKFDESWVFLSDEEIAALYGYTNELLGDDFEEYLKNATVIYDMYAQSTATSCSVNINFEKLSALGSMQTANMEVFVSSVMPTVVDSLESAGCSNVTYELCDIKIGDKTFEGSTLSAELMGVKLYQVLICIKCDGYIANISIASPLADNTQSIIDCFYILD